MMTSGTAGSLEELEKMTQLDGKRSLMDDRAHEVGEYFGISADEARSIYNTYNVERSIKAPKFDGTNLKSIIASYTHEEVLRRDLTRLMLHYTRLEKAFRILPTLNQAYPDRTKHVSMIDYGCGAADFGIAFALHGYSVTLVDLADGNLGFAKWRFKRRGLDCRTIAISETLEYPNLTGADVVVAADVLEHLRDPREAVRVIHKGLSPKGFFWFPDFPFKEKKIGGSHLVEAANLREESTALVHKLFTRHESKIAYLMEVK